MKRLEELLTGWNAGTLSAEETAELKRLLAQPEARAELVNNWLLEEAIYDALRAQPAEAPATARAAARSQPARPAAVRRRRFFPWLVWREARITLGGSLAFAAAACVAFVGIYLYFQNASLGRLANVRDQVIIERHGRQIVAQNGQAVYADDIIRLRGRASVILDWDHEATQLELSPDTDLQLLNPLGGKALSLRAGTLQAAVAAQPHWRPMSIRTPQANATVVGTHFSLAATGAVTRLDVVEGAVRLRKTVLSEQPAEVTVAAGQTAMAAPGLKLQVQFLTGFLSSDTWLVSSGTSFSQAERAGTPLNATAAPPATSNSNVVERLRGYLLAPATGQYTFWIAPFSGDKSAELWLSSDDNPGRKQRIAYARPSSLSQPLNGRAGFNAALQRTPSQKSAPQKLQQGRRYYFEVWHEGSGVNSLALAWLPPNAPPGAQPAMIDVHSLCPFLENPGSGKVAEPPRNP